MTYTRTHVSVGFADPYLKCDECGESVPRWHDPEQCGDSDEFGSWNEPCRHRAGVTSTCPSWSPVDGCRCPETHA